MPAPFLTGIGEMGAIKPGAYADGPTPAPETRKSEEITQFSFIIV
jgi:hypothetical protein